MPYSSRRTRFSYSQSVWSPLDGSFWRLKSPKKVRKIGKNRSSKSLRLPARPGPAPGRRFFNPCAARRHGGSAGPAPPMEWSWSGIGAKFEWRWSEIGMGLEWSWNGLGVKQFTSKFEWHRVTSSGIASLQLHSNFTHSNRVASFKNRLYECIAMSCGLLWSKYAVAAGQIDRSGDGGGQWQPWRCGRHGDVQSAARGDTRESSREPHWACIQPACDLLANLFPTHVLGQSNIACSLRHLKKPSLQATLS